LRRPETQSFRLSDGRQQLNRGPFITRVEAIMEQTCLRCGALNAEERRYCERCLSILEPRTRYWLQVEDFQTTADRDALGMVKSTWLLPHLLNQFFVRPRERKQREILNSQGTPATRFAKLAVLMQDCAYRLCLENLPSIYLIESHGSPNAFTFGSDDAPVIVIDSRLLPAMGTDELRCLLGHEMGHIKSKHLLYHSMAETLANGIGVSASLMGANLISAPLRIALLAWQRESEFSADRAALITSGNPYQVASMFAKLAGLSTPPIQQRPSLLEDLVKLFRTHSNMSERVKAVFSFSNTEEYARIIKKLNDRTMLRGAFAPSCRFCGSSKPVAAVFCPACKRSLV